MCFTNKSHVWFIISLISSYSKGKCDAISNTNFNTQIRAYSTDNINNITHVKTLQKEEPGKYTSFAPATNPIKFKEIPDNALSSSSNGRGLLYHDQPGFLGDYEEGSHFTYGHDYHQHDAHPDIHVAYSYDQDHRGHHDPHEYDHHNHHSSHDYDHHHYPGHPHSDHGHYNKHYKHALAAKTVLWPIAGIALLGAAAALVSNPVLLQLGVISGKRRRRDTDEITGPDFPSDTFKRYAEKIKKTNNYSTFIKPDESIGKITKDKDKNVSLINDIFKKRVSKIDNLTNVKPNSVVKTIRPSIKRNIDQVTAAYNSNIDDDRFIPIAIKLRTPKGSK